MARGREIPYAVVVTNRSRPNIMNTTITFPAPEPVLKLVRPPTEKWAASLAEERRRLQEDHEALREREKNLRDYEARLRALQAEIDAGRGAAAMLREPPTSDPVRAPSGDDTMHPAAWAKLHRAREILEAEQAHLRDDRLAVREQEAVVKRREDAVAARETRLTEREALVAAAFPESGEPIASERTMSAVTRLTRAPFDMARSVFGGRKKDA